MTALATLYAICGPAPTRGPRSYDLTIGELDSILGDVPPGGGYGGSWISWYLRVVFGAKYGLPVARRIVIGAVGPGHDYEAPERVIPGAAFRLRKRGRRSR